MPGRTPIPRLTPTTNGFGGFAVNPSIPYPGGRVLTSDVEDAGNAMNFGGNPAQRFNPTPTPSPSPTPLRGPQVQIDPDLRDIAMGRKPWNVSPTPTPVPQPSPTAIPPFQSDPSGTGLVSHEIRDFNNGVYDPHRIERTWWSPGDELGMQGMPRTLPNSTPPTRVEIPPQREYSPNLGGDLYTWDAYYTPDSGRDVYKWDQYPDTLPLQEAETPPNATGGEPTLPRDADPTLLRQNPPRAGDYFDFTDNGLVRGNNIVPPTDFGDRPMPNLLGFGLVPNLPPTQLGSLDAGRDYVSGGDIYLGGELAGHTPGSDGTTMIGDTSEGDNYQQLINDQRSSLGLPPQAPPGSGGIVTGTEGAPPGMTVIGHDSVNGQPIYRDAAGHLYVNPGTGTMDQTSRFSENSGTGNWVADKTMDNFLASGGYPGTPNRALPDSRDTFAPGSMGVLDQESGILRGVKAPVIAGGGFKMSQKSGAPTLRNGDPKSVAAYNAWLMQQPEYKAFMQRMLGAGATPSFQSSGGPTPRSGSGGG